jgi:hypothetical protein
MIEMDKEINIIGLSKEIENSEKNILKLIYDTY